MLMVHCQNFFATHFQYYSLLVQTRSRTLLNVIFYTVIHNIQKIIYFFIFKITFCYQCGWLVMVVQERMDGPCKHVHLHS